MTEKEIITKRIPLCVNIQRLAAYLLADYEVILFDWLTIKQSLHFGFKPFYCSLHRLEKETRLKRRRLEKAIKRFCAMDILQVTTGRKEHGSGKVTYYRMNFRGVVKRLNEIVDQDSEIAKDFNIYFKALANLQDRAEKGKESKREKSDREHAEELYDDLNHVYWNRIDMYNGGELTEKVPKTKKSKTQLTKDRDVIEKLQSLSGRYNDFTIHNSFTALCDAYLIEDDSSANVDNLIKYFLSYKPEKDKFGVFDKYLAIFQKEYDYE